MDVIADEDRIIFHEGLEASCAACLHVALTEEASQPPADPPATAYAKKIPNLWKFLKNPDDFFGAQNKDFSARFSKTLAHSLGISCKAFHELCVAITQKDKKNYVRKLF